jgi:hypothetical protein
MNTSGHTGGGVMSEAVAFVLGYVAGVVSFAVLSVTMYRKRQGERLNRQIKSERWDRLEKWSDHE